MLLNRTSIPTLIVIMNGAVILSQMTGVAMASVNRYLKLCMPTSSITAVDSQFSIYNSNLEVRHDFYRQTSFNCIIYSDSHLNDDSV